jgi:hypothetical protein
MPRCIAEVGLHQEPSIERQHGNAVEGVNGDLKQAVTQREPARSKAQLKRAVVGHMRRLSKLPDRVRSFFGHRTVRYAA